VVADGVMDRFADGLLCLRVETGNEINPGAVDCQGVEDVVSALDDEVCGDGLDFLERHGTAVGGI